MIRPIQVFLIDDDEDEHVLFENALNGIDENIDCYHAMSGEEAIRMLASGEYSPDYIFLDLKMPRMDGKECLWKLKDMLSVPVIIYTTLLLAKDIDDSRTLGAEWFLVKPASRAQLKQSISMILYDVRPKNLSIPLLKGVYKLNAVTHGLFSHSWSYN